MSGNLFNDPRKWSLLFQFSCEPNVIPGSEIVDFTYHTWSWERNIAFIITDFKHNNSIHKIYMKFPMDSSRNRFQVFGIPFPLTILVDYKLHKFVW